jgi:DNA-binding CsgD family transcriptional regulator
MALLHLSARARQILQRIARSNTDAREVRRAQILLWLDAHQTVQEIAARLGRTRQAIYALAQRYQARRTLPVAGRIRDATRSGRPATKGERTLQVIQTLLARPVLAENLVRPSLCGSLWLKLPIGNHGATHLELGMRGSCLSPGSPEPEDLLPGFSAHFPGAVARD